MFIQARICALAFYAQQRFNAVGMLCALIRQDAARFEVRIADCTLWTLTLKGTRRVVANRAEVTWSFFAFVYIEATAVGVGKSASASTKSKLIKKLSENFACIVQ